MVQGYKPKLMIFSYSASHFFVDFACAFLMFKSIASSPDWYLAVLLYNFCAFAMQMPLGILADSYNRNYLFALVGCLLVASAYGLVQFSALAATIAGLGNALFHIGGGVDILNISQEKSSALGIFVSPGALGLYLGTISANTGGFPVFFVLLALVGSALIIFYSHRAQGGEYPSNSEFSLQSTTPHSRLIAATCLFLVVCLRSHVGLTLNFPWKGIGSWGLILIGAVVLGKVAGGFAADRFGLIKTSVLSLSVATILFLLSGIPLAGVTSVLLFNMTMPITLWVMAKIFPGAKGFSFGLLTFGLFIGYMPKYFALGTSAPAWFFALMAAVSLALLYFGIRRSGVSNQADRRRIRP